MLNDYCAVTRPRDGVAQLTIVNAGKATVLSAPVIEGVTAGLGELARESGLRALVLASASDRSFIAGADLNEMSRLDESNGAAFIRRLHALCEAVRGFPAPVVARIQGWCLGGGLELAMACDMRVAAPAARFSMPEVKVGIPSVIHAALMPRLIGMARARWLIMTGATIDAAKALDWGLIDILAAEGELDAAVAEALEPILACGPAVIASQKALLRAWEDQPLAEAMEGSVAAFAKAFATGEPQRYMQAFFDAKARKGG